MAARTVMLLRLCLLFAIFCIKKKSFVTADIIGTVFDIDDGNLSHESFVFSTLHQRKLQGERYKTSHCLYLNLILLLSGDIEVCPGPSITRQKFKEKLRARGLKIAQQNIRGLHCNFDSFQEFLTSHNELDVIGLTETHIRDKDINEHLKVEGYSFVGRNRTVGTGGGVGIFIKNNINFKHRTDLQHGSVECVYIEIFVKKSNSIILGCFYRPPEGSKYLSNDFNDRFNENINNALNENKEMIIIGDFNVDYQNKSSSPAFKEIMTLNGFKQIITTATRITKDSSTLIDHIFVNKPSLFPSTDVVATSLSDHDLVFCRRKINSAKFPHRIIKCRNYSRYNPVDLKNDVRNVDWTPVHENTNNVNAAVFYLTNSLKTLFDKHAPFIEKRVKGKPCNWMDDNIKKEINKRDKLLRSARGKKSDNSWNEYKRQRNKCTSLIRNAKSKYFRNMLDETQVNPKNFWKTIKAIFPTKAKSTEGTLSSENRVQIFADYFSTIVQKMKSVSFPLINCTWRYCRKRPLRTKDIFKFKSVSSAYVLKELKKLKRNKATGIDSLPPNMLKDCAEEIAQPLSHIINLSLGTNTVPSLWKSAKICPVFKSGDSDMVENFRPISILPVLSKLLERTVHDQLYNFLESGNLLNECQYGFRKKRSTKLAATYLCDSIRSHFEKGQLVGCLYLDLSKAFDTMGHGILLEKLLRHGVCGPELAWFTDYLFQRNQTVELNNNSSMPHNVTTGVPQGSILGPLLFIIFFDDLHEEVRKCYVLQYADDTVIFYGSKCPDSIENALNCDLEAIAKYCQENELLINFKKGKTEVMLLGTAKRMKSHGRDLQISYNNVAVNIVTEYVYLGNLIDHHLNLSKNFDRSYKKASSRLRLLKSVRKYLTKRASEAIYELTILPLLTYGSTIKTVLSVTQRNKLSSLELRASKVIGAPVKKTTSVIVKQIVGLVKSCLQKELKHDVFDNYFEVINHSKRTRNNNCSLRLPKVKLEISKQGFKYGGSKFFNQLPKCERDFLLNE